ncbi:MAG TPA: hypothetical protein VM286_05315 [Candidatus Thermoplasmatota archaeon]|nr:hypothetical protein [Candidatus Thermoplasmatota archaeon]
MFRTLVWPALAFLTGVGALKAAIPLESLALMAVGLALSSFGLLRLMLRDVEPRSRPAFTPMATAVRVADDD